MALCERCVHTDVCVHKCILGGDVEGVKCCVHFIPKDDFVSASVMTKLFELETYAKTHDADVKKEVAREIFEEIERFLYLQFRFCKEEIGNDDTEYVKGRLEHNTHMQDLIAELKKKYTE